MPQSTITLGQVNLELSDVADVVVTPIVQDTEVGDYVRDIRFIGANFIDGVEYMIAQVRIRSSVAADLDIDAPAQKF